VLKWQPLPVPEHYSRETVEERIHVREFVLRFSELFELSKSRLGELDNIVGDVYEDEDEEMEPLFSWVGEPCLREIIVGLLDTIGEEVEGSIKKVRGCFCVQGVIC
jgi:hypothetical protein